MANIFKCDICGKETWIYPPYKQKFDTKVIEGVEVKVPITKFIKRQNLHTGGIETVEVADLEYEKPITCIIKLQIAGQEIQKDFCEECTSVVMEEATSLWNKLEGIESK